MAEPPFPPPDPRRPFDWTRDAPEWGDEAMDEDWAGCLYVLLAFACLGAGMIMLYVWFL